MRVIRTVKEVKEEIEYLKGQGKTIGFVPTMGYLHQGHLSLIDEARKESDIVIVSIFVNEAQFNDKKDFENYPQDLEKDIEKLTKKEVDILFCPSNKEIYPEISRANFDLGNLADNLCGKYRGGHFQGVALVVSKLFDIITPDVAIFGQKDFQQLQIVKKLTKDLNLGIKIISAPILREESGLAMSSRNSRLNEGELRKSAKIYEILNNTKSQILASDNKELENILENSRLELGRYFDKVDYLEVCDEENLQIIKDFNKIRQSRIFVAVYLGQVRLIDNIKLM